MAIQVTYELVKPENFFNMIIDSEKLEMEYLKENPLSWSAYKEGFAELETFKNLINLIGETVVNSYFEDCWEMLEEDNDLFIQSIINAMSIGAMTSYSDNLVLANAFDYFCKIEQVKKTLVQLFRNIIKRIEIKKPF